MDIVLGPLHNAASLVAKLAANPIGLTLIAAGLACGILRRPWYLAPFLAATYTMVTIGYGLSGIGHGSSSRNRLMEYWQFLFAYTLISLIACDVGLLIRRIIAPGQAKIRSPEETNLVIVLSIAAVIATTFGIAYWLRRW